MPVTNEEKARMAAPWMFTGQPQRNGVLQMMQKSQINQIGRQQPQTMLPNLAKPLKVDDYFYSDQAPQMQQWHGSTTGPGNMQGTLKDMDPTARRQFEGLDADLTNLAARNSLYGHNALTDEQFTEFYNAPGNTGDYGQYWSDPKAAHGANPYGWFTGGGDVNQYLDPEQETGVARAMRLGLAASPEAYAENWQRLNPEKGGPGGIAGVAQSINSFLGDNLNWIVPAAMAAMGGAAALQLGAAPTAAQSALTAGEAAPTFLAGSTAPLSNVPYAGLGIGNPANYTAAPTMGPTPAGSPDLVGMLAEAHQGDPLANPTFWSRAPDVATATDAMLPATALDTASALPQLTEAELLEAATTLGGVVEGTAAATPTVAGTLLKAAPSVLALTGAMGGGGGDININAPDLTAGGVASDGDLGGEDMETFDPYASPLWPVYKKTAEDQFQRARQNIMSTLPQGGNLLEQLAQAEMAKAGVLTEGAGTIGQDAINRAHQKDLARLGANVTMSGQNLTGDIARAQLGQQSDQYTQLMMLELAKALGSGGGLDWIGDLGDLFNW
jgi:hypothetical protein